MSQFLGEYDCKVDAKGRMRLPSQLIKQFDGLEQSGFIMNRGLDKCLTLYPKAEWDKITNELGKLNQYVKKNRDFIRFFFRGATEVTLDSSDRILIKKNLKEYAGIDSDVYITCFLNKIELWAGEESENLIEDKPELYSDLAEEVMGNINNRQD
jgi:MraZ protein